MLRAPTRYSAGILVLAKAIASFDRAKQHGHIASLSPVLTSGPDGLSAAADDLI